MERALQKLDSTKVKTVVTWKPFFLDPNLPMKSRDKMANYNRKFGEDRVKQIIPYMKQVGASEGINFSYEGKIGNTTNSHRLLEKALKDGGPELQDKLIEVLFAYYFEQEKDIADNETLATAALEGGVFTKKDDALTFLKSDEFTAEVMAGVQEAYQMRISGVPHFLIGGNKYSLSGGQDPSKFIEIFKKLSFL